MKLIAFSSRRTLQGLKSIRYTDRFDDPNLPGEMQVTVTFKQTSVGTEMQVVHEGVPTVIPAKPAIPAGRSR